MTLEAILADVRNVICDILDNPDLVIVASTTARDVPDWDSLAHVQIAVAIERHFKIRFKSSEILGFKNVGEMCEAVQRKLPA